MKQWLPDDICMSSLLSNDRMQWVSKCLFNVCVSAGSICHYDLRGFTLLRTSLSTQWNGLASHIARPVVLEYRKDSDLKYF